MGVRSSVVLLHLVMNRTCSLFLFIEPKSGFMMTKARLKIPVSDIVFMMFNGGGQVSVHQSCLSLTDSLKPLAESVRFTGIDADDKRGFSTGF